MPSSIPLLRSRDVVEKRCREQVTKSELRNKCRPFVGVRWVELLSLYTTVRISINRHLKGGCNNEFRPARELVLVYLDSIAPLVKLPKDVFKGFSYIMM